MSVVIDTSAVIAVISNEQSRARILELTQDEELLAPPTLRWEVANAFSAMFKRRQVDLTKALEAIALFEQIPIRSLDVPLHEIVKYANSLNIYAYDACMIACAQVAHAPLITLDSGLRDAARRARVNVVEVTP